MAENIGVLVGTGIGGQRNIFDAIEREGFAVKSAVARQWPRDHFVHLKKSYVKREPNDNHFGEGGYSRVGNGYILLGTGIGDLVTDYSARDFLGFNGEQKLKESSRALTELAEQQFEGMRVHLIPTGKSSGKGHSHLDMSTLLAPTNKILVVDSHYGRYASEDGRIDKIGEIEGLKVIRYDGSQDGVWYPLNSLILNNGERDIAFIDERAKSLAKILESEGIKTVGVKMPQHEFPAGKINCQTNTYSLGDDPERLLEKF